MLAFSRRIVHQKLQQSMLVVQVAHQRPPTFSTSRDAASPERRWCAGVEATRRGERVRDFLREYVPGDDPRMVDWKATARYGAARVSREQTIRAIADGRVASLDCSRAMMTAVGGALLPVRACIVVRTCCSSDVTCDEWRSRGTDPPSTTRFEQFVPPLRGSAALKSLRNAMSALDATLTEPDYASAFRMLATRQRRRALVVFFTDVIDLRAARQFVAYAGRAAQRHAMIIVAIQNEALIAAARPGADGALALYRSGAAEELVRERDEALIRRCGRTGITSVLDVAFTRMAAAVVNRYLELKARGGI